MLEIISGGRVPKTSAERSAYAVLTAIVEEIGIDRLAQIQDEVKQQVVLDLMAEKISAIFTEPPPPVPVILSYLKLHIEPKITDLAYLYSSDVTMHTRHHGVDLLNTASSDSILVHFTLDPNKIYRQVFVKNRLALIVESDPYITEADISDWVCKRLRDRKPFNPSKYGTVIKPNRYPQEVHKKAFYHDAPKIWVSRSITCRHYTVPYIISKG